MRPTCTVSYTSPDILTSIVSALPSRPIGRRLDRRLPPTAWFYEYAFIAISLFEIAMNNANNRECRLAYFPARARMLATPCECTDLEEYRALLRASQDTQEETPSRGERCDAASGRVRGCASLGSANEAERGRAAPSRNARRHGHGGDPVSGDIRVTCGGAYTARGQSRRIRERGGRLACIERPDFAAGQPGQPDFNLADLTRRPNSPVTLRERSKDSAPRRPCARNPFSSWNM